MAGLVYPYEFENDTPADGDQVQEQFDAVKDFLADLNIDSGGIPYSSLDLDNDIVQGDIANDSIGPGELIAPSVGFAYPSSDVSSPGANTQATICQTSALTAGFYILSASVQFKRLSSSGGSCRMRSRLYKNFTQLYPERRTDVDVAASQTIELGHSHFAFLALSEGDIITLAGDSVQSGSFGGSDSFIQYIRLA